MPPNGEANTWLCTRCKTNRPLPMTQALCPCGGKRPRPTGPRYHQHQQSPRDRWINRSLIRWTCHQLERRPSGWGQKIAEYVRRCGEAYDHAVTNGAQCSRCGVSELETLLVNADATGYECRECWGGG